MHHPSGLRLLLILALLAPLGCTAETSAPPAEQDLLFGLDSPGTARMGAPSNAELPDEGKADEVLPAHFDLVATQSPIRNQGHRGVCSIFATTALMEHLYLIDGTLPNPDFSEQFLQWSTKVESGAFPHTSGSNARTNLDNLRRYGTVMEADAPYQSSDWGVSDDPRCTGDEATQPTECFTNGTPSAAALAATRWFVPSGGRFISTAPNSLKAHMVHTNTAVQVGGSFFYQAWGHGGSRIPVYSGYRRQGYVLAPNEADIASSGEHSAGHSYLLVGWDDDLEVQAVDAEGHLATNAAGEPVMQKGFFLFKNSWGTDWAQDNPHGRGYGWIAYDYVENHLSAYVAEAPELSLTELCGDGRDNDFNGQTDCADAACATDRACIDPAHHYVDDAVAAIPDNSPAGLVRTLDVTDAGILSGTSVSVHITHPYRGDLELRLEHAGVTATLFDQQDGAADDLVRTFDLSNFDGKEASGIWTLTVVDHANADTGTLQSWSLDLTTCAGGDCASTPTTLSGMNDTLGVIPDNDPTGVTRDITLSGAGLVGTARLNVDITHPFIGDLVISISKDGRAPIELLREDLVEGNRLMRSFTVPDFAGLDAAGVYTLHVVDAAAGDQGTLNGWNLEVLLQ